MTSIEISVKRHEMDWNSFKNAKITVKAPDESERHEIAATLINTLSYNGAWVFSVTSNSSVETICFKYNGTIAAADAISKLHFKCECSIQSEWE